VGAAREGPARRGYRFNAPQLARPRSRTCRRHRTSQEETPSGGLGAVIAVIAVIVVGIVQGHYSPRIHPQCGTQHRGPPQHMPRAYWRPCYFPSPCSKSGRGRPLLPRPPPPRAGGDRSVPMVAWQMGGGRGTGGRGGGGQGERESEKMGEWNCGEQGSNTTWACWLGGGGVGAGMATGEESMPVG
jgi:hypothetical protein